MPGQQAGVAPWLVLACWMATASLTLVFGRIADLWGRKPISWPSKDCWCCCWRWALHD